MRSFLPMVVAFVALVAVASVVYGTDPNNTSTTTVISTTSSSGTATASGTSGLQLLLSLNSTSLLPGQAVQATVQDYNPLSHSLNLSESSNWPLQNLTLGPCGTLNEPIGVAIFSGYYTAANASSARALQLYQPAYYPCPAIFGHITSYGFLPQNSSAVVYGACVSGPCFTLAVDSTTIAHGYWVGGIGSATFEGFQPGVYTVAAGDEWGDLLFAHFTVG